MPNYLASWQPPKRRDARAAEWTGLENRSRGNSTGGSNPPLSATIQTLSTIPFNDSCHTWYSVGIFTWYKTRHHHLLICPILEDPVWEKFSLFCHKPQPGFQFCDLRIVACPYSSLRNPIFPWLWDHEKYTAVFYLVFFLLTSERLFKQILIPPLWGGGNYNSWFFFCDVGAVRWNIRFNKWHCTNFDIVTNFHRKTNDACICTYVYIITNC